MTHHDTPPATPLVPGVATFAFAGSARRQLRQFAAAGPLRPHLVSTSSSASMRGVRLAGTRAVAFAARATGVRITSPGADCLEPVTLHISDAGPATFGARTLWLRNEATSYDLDAAQGRATVSIAVPVSHLSGPTGHLDLRSGVAVEASPVAQAAFRSLQAVLTTSAVTEWTTHSPAAVDRYLIGIASLISSIVLADHVGDRDDEQRGWLRLRATEIIDTQFYDPALSPAKIAARLEISMRSLHRAFEGSTGVAESLRLRRLEHAASLLADSAMSRLPVQEIGRRAGFWSTTTFDRAFHVAYRLSPLQYKQARG